MAHPSINNYSATRKKWHDLCAWKNKTKNLPRYLFMRKEKQDDYQSVYYAIIYEEMCHLFLSAKSFF